MLVFRDDNYWLVDDVMWSDCWETFVIQGVDKIRYYGYCYGMFFFVWPVSFYHASKDSFQLQLRDMTFRKNGCFKQMFETKLLWFVGFFDCHFLGAWKNNTKTQVPHEGPMLFGSILNERHFQRLDSIVVALLDDVTSPKKQGKRHFWGIFQSLWVCMVDDSVKDFL